MSSEPSEESVELMVLRDVQQRIDVSAAVIMEVGNQRDNPSSGDSTTDNQSLVSLSQRISELEDHMYSAQLRTPKVKVTPWRLLNTVLVLGLGIYKATATYRGQDTTPTTLDWIIGVLWALIAYWASFLEDAHLSPGARWFFDLDVSQILWSLFLLILWPSALGLLCWGTIMFGKIPRSDNGILFALQTLFSVVLGLLCGFFAIFMYIYVVGDILCRT